MDTGIDNNDFEQKRSVKLYNENIYSLIVTQQLIYSTKLFKDWRRANHVLVSGDMMTPECEQPISTPLV